MTATTAPAIWTVCPECTQSDERKLIEVAARRQGRRVLNDLCLRCTRAAARVHVKRIASSVVNERRCAASEDVTEIARDLASMTREGIVEIALLLATELATERGRKA